jgi:hypothetical protein
MKRLLSLLSLFFAFTGINAQSEIWYKGNLHTHSYWSDGDEFPELIMDWYKKNGYQFIGLSDHNTLAAGEKWKMIAKSKLYEDSFAKYLEKYGKDWVTYKVDSGRTIVKLKTLAEYKPLFEDKNFLIIQAEEITSRFENKPIHMNATNIQTIIGPQSGGSVTEVMQKTVDAVLKQREETGVPMIPHLNHPNFGFGVSVQDIIDLKGERFFEVYNGHPYVNNYGDSLHPGMEEMWDRINVAYLNRGQAIMYGLATDDSHNYHQFGKTFSNSGRGWVMVKAKALTPEALLSALEAGQFYSSTGVTLDQVSYHNHKLAVDIKEEAGIQYTIEFIGVVRGEQKSVVLKKVTGTKADFTVTDKHLFVRARITSSKKKENPYQEGDVEMAWTQPVTY